MKRRRLGRGCRHPRKGDQRPTKPPFCAKWLFCTPAAGGCAQGWHDAQQPAGKGAEGRKPDANVKQPEPPTLGGTAANDQSRQPTTSAPTNQDTPLPLRGGGVKNNATPLTSSGQCGILSVAWTGNQFRPTPARERVQKPRQVRRLSACSGVGTCVPSVQTSSLSVYMHRVRCHETSRQPGVGV